MSAYSTGCTQACNQGRDCTCVIQHCQSAAPEGGNVWFAEPEPVQIRPIEAIVIYGGYCTAANQIYGEFANHGN